MTLAQFKVRRSNHRHPRKNWSPGELNDLWALAERLQGRPLPRVNLTEAEFEAEYGDEDINAEWVDGQVIVMAPVSGEHSDLNVWLIRLLSESVDQNDLGLIRGPEFSIRLAPIRRQRNPDVMFVAKSRYSKLHPTYFDGAPDLIVEIVSSDSEDRDRRDKYADYESSGVREYWIVDPLAKRVDVFSLGRSKKYAVIVPDGQGRIQSKVLKGLFVKAEWLWRRPLPKLAGILKELGI